MGRTACTEPQCQYKSALYDFTRQYHLYYVRNTCLGCEADNLTCPLANHERVWSNIIAPYIFNLSVCRSWTDSSFGSFTPGKTAQAAYWRGGSLGRACVSAVNMRKTPCPYQQRNCDSLVVQLVVKSLGISHYRLLYSSKGCKDVDWNKLA